MVYITLTGNGTNMSASLIGKNGTTIATLSNPVPVQLSTDLASPNIIEFADPDPMVDSFQRLRVSEPRLAFSWTWANGVRAEYWDSAVFGAGTFLPAAIAVGAVPPALNLDVCQNLNTTTASGTGAWVQSMHHVKYHAGISTKAHFTFMPTVLQANQSVRVGCFTDQGTFPSNAGDGIFWEAVGTAQFISRRYLTGGGVGAVEQVAQASWNMDKLNGTGFSGINLDFTKTQHLVIEWQWLGVGTIRVGFETGNAGTVWAHQFSSVNSLSAPWSRTGTLPMRAEIYTTGVTGQAGLLKLINCCILQEGDVMQYRQTWRYRSSVGLTAGKAMLATAAVGTLSPMIALRPSITNDITKRALVIPTKASILVVTAATGPTALQWALVYAPTTFTTPTFAALVTEGANVDTASAVASIAGGITVASGVLPNVANTIVNIDLKYAEDNLIKIANNAAGSLTILGGNVFVLCVGPLVVAATVGGNFVCSLDWKEDV
jgi:hypothetical protein